MTFISRLLGFVREMVLAFVFGASGGMDAFIIAFKLPNFMRRLFAEGAFSQAFVPVLSEYRSQRPEQVRSFIDHMLGTLAMMLFIVVGIAILFAPLLVHVFAPGFADDSLRFELTTHMLRIMFPYLLLIALTAFAGAVLNTYGRFAIPAITPVLLNLALISAALFATIHFKQPIVALAWAVLIAGFMQLLLQLPFLRKTSHLPCPKPNWRDPGVRRVLTLMVPALFGVSITQISILIDSIFASFLPIGSISWLYYADRLMNFPLGVFGVALATVVLPYLSRKHAERDAHNYAHTIDWAIRSVLLVGIPSVIGLLLLASPILTTLLQHGRFSEHDVLMTSQSLLAFALGVPAFMLVKILASGFYAKQDIKTPVKIAAIAMVTNIVLNAALITPLAHAGLALATSLAAMLNASLLLMALYKQRIYIPSRGWLVFAGRLLLANGVMGIVLFAIHQPIAVWHSWSDGWRFVALAWRIGLAITCYISILWLSGFRLSRLWQIGDEPSCN